VARRQGEGPQPCSAEARPGLLALLLVWRGCRRCAGAWRGACLAAGELAIWLSWTNRVHTLSRWALLRGARSLLLARRIAWTAQPHSTLHGVRSTGGRRNAQIRAWKRVVVAWRHCCRCAARVNTRVFGGECRMRRMHAGRLQRCGFVGECAGDGLWPGGVDAARCFLLSCWAALEVALGAIAHCISAALLWPVILGTLWVAAYLAHAGGGASGHSRSTRGGPRR